MSDREPSVDEIRSNLDKCPVCGGEFDAVARVGEMGRLEGVGVCIRYETVFFHGESANVPTTRLDEEGPEATFRNVAFSGPSQYFEVEHIGEPPETESVTEKVRTPTAEERDDTITPEEAVEAMERGEVIAYENSLTRYWGKEISEGEFVTHFDPQGWLKSPKHRKRSREEMVDELQLFLGSGPGTIWVCEDDEEVPEFPPEHGDSES